MLTNPFVPKGTAKRLAFALAPIVALALVPSAALAADPPPPANLYKFAWRTADCVETDDGGTRAIGSVRTTVIGIPASDSGTRKTRYYQEVKVQIDRSINESNTSWRQVPGASKVYDWTRFGRRSPLLPIHSTSSYSTGAQPGLGMLSAKATVWLKRVRAGRLPDKTVWKYTRRSAVFTCFDDGFGDGSSASAASRGGTGSGKWRMSDEPSSVRYTLDGLLNWTMSDTVLSLAGRVYVRAPKAKKAVCLRQYWDFYALNDPGETVRLKVNDKRYKVTKSLLPTPGDPRSRYQVTVNTEHKTRVRLLKFRPLKFTTTDGAIFRPNRSATGRLTEGRPVTTEKQCERQGFGDQYSFGVR